MCHGGSVLHSIKAAPKDAMFGLTAAYNADTDSGKVNLGVGSYKHVEGEHWILPSVRQAENRLHEQVDLDHEYLPIAGHNAFREASSRLVFGQQSTALQEGRIATIQTLSGTGALSLAARFISRFLDSTSRKVYVSDPPYVNHIPILQEADLETGRYSYYSPRTQTLDFEALTASIESKPDGSIILLHACGHNPTGVDPTKQQWTAISKIMKGKRMIPLLDSAYQGFASGNIDDDAWAVRHFVEAGFDAILVAQSYAKNFGLYGERAGCLHLVAPNATISRAWLSQLERLQRVSISTPPAYGARLISLVLNDTDLYNQWLQDLAVMSSRIALMRLALRQRLEPSKQSAQWQHLTDQVGMFCYTGLTERQVRTLREKHHIFMTAEGRINVSGLNDSNVDYVAKAIKSSMSEARL